MPILLKHQPWNHTPEDPARPDVEWNTWLTRQQPFQSIEIGDQVVLVSAGGPTAGMLTWQVEVTDVIKERYSSHDEAWRLIRPLGVTRADFRNNEYTRKAPPAGWLLAWSYRPVRKIMQPRTPDHHIGRNGWGATDFLHVKGGGAVHQGQGRLADPALRRLVELAAMRRVRRWLTEQNHSDRRIVDTSATCPYDYEVNPVRGPRFRIEVKGATGGRGPVIVTAGEVTAALEDGVRTVLAVVHDIELTMDPDGRWKADGGELWLDEDWRPTDETLQQTQYRYQPAYQS